MLFSTVAVNMAMMMLLLLLLFFNYFMKPFSGFVFVSFRILFNPSSIQLHFYRFLCHFRYNKMLRPCHIIRVAACVFGRSMLLIHGILFVFLSRLFMEFRLLKNIDFSKKKLKKNKET